MDKRVWVEKNRVVFGKQTFLGKYGKTDNFWEKQTIFCEKFPVSKT
jgi:hypothetical protein